MRYPLSYALSPLVALIAIGGFYLGGIGYFALPIAAFVLLPPIDVWRGFSHWPSAKALERMPKAMIRRFEAAVPLAAGVTIALLAWGLWVASTTPLAWWQFAGLALSIGLNSGLMGIVVAHELMHRNGAGERRTGFLLMALVGYAHFCVEHVRGHHMRVATPEDPATARAGENIYAFLPRSIFQGLASGWRLEAERLGRAGRPVWSWHNDILVWHGFTVLLAIAIGLLLGPASLLLFVLQALVAVTILEMINYIEHYGLLRAQGADGRYERVRPVHSWNSSYILTNVNLFNLGRHSDHHAQSTRPFYKLRHYDEAPQLPYGYSAMFVIATIPPLWFRIMDRELERYRARSVAA